jgi:membrane protease YdiL (CAAX protease family)
MTAFDYALLIALLILVPANSLWRSLAGRGSTLSRMARYGRTIGIISVLLALLALDWRLSGRSLESLGLDIPPSLPGLAGLGVAIVLTVAMVMMARIAPRRGGSGTDQTALLMPQSPAEYRIFILFSLAVGIGWELLYRGYLLWALTPLLGLPGAIALATLVYGLAHGYKSRRLFIGSLISSMLFVGGYALTGSLWWLMLVHSALPLVGLLTPPRAAEAAA